MALSHATESLQDTTKSIARDFSSLFFARMGSRPSVIQPLVDPRLFANRMMEILVGPHLQLAPLSRQVEQHLVLGYYYYYYNYCQLLY